MRRRAAAVLLAALYAGCAPAPVSAPSAAAPFASAAPPLASAAAPAPSAAFLRAPLKDVRTGETFTLADNPGGVTIVQGMAVW